MLLHRSGSGGGGGGGGEELFGWGLGMGTGDTGVGAEEAGAELVALHFSELMDALMLLYHLGMSGLFKQASFQLQSQMQTISQLVDTDRRIQQYASTTGDLVRHLKEARAVFRADVVDSVRLCAWYRVTLFSRWKQAVMFSACSYMARLLLAVGARPRLMAYVPELYVEATVDAFHALRRGDPPFTPAGAGGSHGAAMEGLGDIITFLVTHFNDARVVNPDVRDVLLQSISVLLQYKEYVAAFQVNQAARDGMVEALLSSFDGRFWIPISNILLRLVRGSGFGQHREGGGGGGGVGAEECSSQVFQRLLCATCEGDAKLLSGFLNRIFNTLNWTITEFSVAMKEMNHAITKRQANDLQHHQRKCTIMFELSVNLERILEFLTLHLWHVFLDADAEMNLTRLCESLVFLLNHTTCGPDARLFESTLQLQMQQLEKISRALILAPCVGIILNLHRAATARDGGGGGGGA
jgi:Kip1 ubiquitination-promoting complex protein 1